MQETAQENAVPPTGNIKIGMTSDHGLLRHRAVVAACLGFSGIVLLASTIDLKQMVSRPAMIDPTKHLISMPNAAELPANITFSQENRNYGPLRAISEGLIPIVESSWNEGERYGFADQNGKIVINPQYLEVGDFHEGLAWVGIKSAEPGRVVRGFINKQGRMLVQPVYSSTGEFNNGLAPVTWDDYSGLIDSNGKLVFKMKSGTLPERVGEGFSVHEDGKYRLIDRQGNALSEQTFDRLQAFTGSGYSYHPYDRFITDSNNYISTPHQHLLAGHSCAEKQLKAWKNGKCGVVDLTGKLLIPFLDDEILGYTSSYGIVRSGDGSLRFVNSAGEFVETIKPFQDTTYFADLTAIQRDSKWQLIDKEGNILTNAAHFDEPIVGARGYWFADGLAPVLVEGKCGYLNESGQLAIPAKFEFATPFFHGLALIWDGSYWSYIDTHGEIVKFDTVSRFSTANHFCDGAYVEIPGPLYFLQKAKIEDDVKNNCLKSWKEQAKNSCSLNCKH